MMSNPTIVQENPRRLAITKRRKSGSPARLRRGSRELPRSSWVARLAIPGAVLVGVALAWSWWRRHELSQAPHTATAQSALSAAQRTPIEPSAGSSAVATQPQTEAADLKRGAVAEAEQVAEAYP